MDVDLSSPSSSYVRNLHTSLIFRLPQEIISEIFYFVRAFVNSLGYHQRPVPSWIVSTSHVSSRLRHIAINESPFLWIYIKASNMEQAEVFARRAKNAPLNFRLSKPQVLPAELESINSFLSRHSNHLGRLAVALNKEEMSSFLGALTVPLPPTITLVAKPSSPGELPLVYKPILSEGTIQRAMLSVTLTNVALPWSPLVLHGLRNLAISHCNSTSILPNSLSTFLDVLEASPNLESLSLKYSDPRSTSLQSLLVQHTSVFSLQQEQQQQGHRTTHGHLIKLPHLRKCTLCLNARTIHDILDNLILPSTTKISLETCLSGALQPQLNVGVVTLCADILPSTINDIYAAHKIERISIEAGTFIENIAVPFRGTFVMSRISLQFTSYDINSTNPSSSSSFSPSATNPSSLSISPGATTGHNLTPSSSHSLTGLFNPENKSQEITMNVEFSPRSDEEMAILQMKKLIGHLAILSGSHLTTTTSSTWVHSLRHLKLSRVFWIVKKEDWILLFENFYNLESLVIRNSHSLSSTTQPQPRQQNDQVVTLTKESFSTFKDFLQVLSPVSPFSAFSTDTLDRPQIEPLSSSSSLSTSTNSETRVPTLLPNLRLLHLHDFVFSKKYLSMIQSTLSSRVQLGRLKPLEMVRLQLYYVSEYQNENQNEENGRVEEEEEDLECVMENPDKVNLEWFERSVQPLFVENLELGLNRGPKFQRLLR